MGGCLTACGIVIRTLYCLVRYGGGCPEENNGAAHNTSRLLRGASGSNTTHDDHDCDEQKMMDYAVVGYWLITIPNLIPMPVSYTHLTLPTTPYV